MKIPVRFRPLDADIEIWLENGWKKNPTRKENLNCSKFFRLENFLDKSILYHLSHMKQEKIQKLVKLQRLE